MRPIDADALMNKLDIKEHCDDCVHAYGIYCDKIGSFVEACRAISDAPTIEPERKTGKWVHGREIGREMIGDAITAIWYEGWQCSECKCVVEEEREPLWKFCPYCGAKMEGHVLPQSNSKLIIN